MTLRESISILDGTRESHIGSARTSLEVGNDESDTHGHVADGSSRVPVKTRRHCAASFARRRRRRHVGVRVSWSYPATQRTRKTAGYSVQCAFVSRARSRKDAVGILAGSSVVILIVTEGGVRFSCFLTCASRICITMFRHGRARSARMFANFLPLSAPRAFVPSSLPLYFSFLE